MPLPSSPTGWSDDRVVTLSKLWLDGLSASQIARQLGGVTRNAVIGKVHRLGLGGRGAPSRPGRMSHAATPRVRRQARVVAPAPKSRSSSALALVPPSVVPEGPGLVADLAQLGRHVCKWPIGDPKSADFSFCGRPTDGRYCATHEDLGVRRGTAWRADRDPVVKRALAGLI